MSEFRTITGEDWRRSLIAARSHRSGSANRIRSQISAHHLMPTTSALYSGEIPASEVIAHLKQNAEVSAALIAEIRALVAGSHARHYTGTGAINEPYTVECSAWEGIIAALAKTPESVGADLAKIRKRIQELEEQVTHLRFTEIPTITKLLGRETVWRCDAEAQRDALILAGNKIVKNGTGGFGTLSAWDAAIDAARKTGGVQP